MDILYGNKGSYMENHKDKIREKFENWIHEYFEYHIDLSKSQNGDYIDGQIHNMWQACQSHDEEIKGLRAAIIAYRDLSICYRIGKGPTEKLFKQLDKADLILKDGV